jgi:hypothetical protein
MGYTTAYFAAYHKLTNGCSQLCPSDLLDFLAYLNVPDIHKFNVEKISWLVNVYIFIVDTHLILTRFHHTD